VDRKDRYFYCIFQKIENKNRKKENTNEGRREGRKVYRCNMGRLTYWHQFTFGLRQTWYSWACPNSMNGLKYASGASAFQAADAWLAAKQNEQKPCSRIFQQPKAFIYWPCCVYLSGVGKLPGSQAGVANRLLEGSKGPLAFFLQIWFFQFGPNSVAACKNTWIKEFSPRILAAVFLCQLVCMILQRCCCVLVPKPALTRQATLLFEARHWDEGGTMHSCGLD